VVIAGPAVLGVLESDVGLEQGLLHIGVRAVERAAKSFDRRLQAGVVEATALVVCEGSEQRGAHAFVLLVHQTASESLGRSVLDVIGSPVSGAASAATAPEAPLTPVASIEGR